MEASSVACIRCFLCRRKHSKAKIHKSIESVCPLSKKSIRDILIYLARCNETELLIPRNEWLCIGCYHQIVDYDTTLMKIIEKQKILAQLVEAAAISIDSDLEQECNVTLKEIINKDNLFDDVDSIISDTDIEETVGKEFGIVENKRKSLSPKRINDEIPTGAELAKCTLCAMRFKSKIRLHKHIAMAHKKFSCNKCNYNHRNEDYVMLHMNVHEGRNENQCRFCGKIFTTKISTIRHMEVHLDSKKYQCDKCGLCFSQNTVLYNHKLQHEAEDHPLHCEVCNQIFKTKRTFRHHMITHQANRPRYSCEYCAKTFTEKYTLKVHKRSHHEANQNIVKPQETTPVLSMETQPTTIGSTLETKYSCVICDQSFSNKDHLNKHMEKEHDVILKSLTLTNFSQYEVVTNEPKKSCHICGHMFSTKNNLNYHLEHMHDISFK